MKIAIIGAGEMGGAFAQGLLNGTLFNAADITVANPHEGKLEKFARQGASVTTDNRVAVQGADFVAIVVKPDVMPTVLEEIKDVLDFSSQIVLNMAASVSLRQLKAWLATADGFPCVMQVLPNVGIAVRQSMTFIVPDESDQATVDRVRAIFDDLGQTIVTTEQMLPAGTAMAGCAIAYVMRYVRAASEAGVELGFKAGQARDITLQTIQGAVSLLRETGMHPEAGVDTVTTPGGLTIKGLNTLERYGFSNAVIQGIKAGMKEL